MYHDEEAARLANEAWRLSSIAEKELEKFMEDVKMREEDRAKFWDLWVEYKRTTAEFFYKMNEIVMARDLFKPD